MKHEACSTTEKKAGGSEGEVTIATRYQMLSSTTKNATLRAAADKSVCPFVGHHQTSETYIYKPLDLGPGQHTTTSHPGNVISTNRSAHEHAPEVR